ncbi:Predicted transcriptional regulator [Marinactinospora thermotolerans DSM 45154]|uniref:Predicted transcriptional regulator n=2 Tax=Marinactinospora thermotolerans TaxID=531310 RepID=A0A1T4SDN0_9ACTN|nr:BlaI/MecI/CopY family transcriptional regulator [Marinactinospora thermotolerans]SKA26329.1 Predicted transcriptional regulator [Marinactinospora thermotolerans DSM 45154]
MKKEFGELESAIMDALWRADRPLVVREVRERMTYDREVAYTTVMTVANILYHKGLLDREKSGRAWRYRPRETREEHTARVMSEVLRSSGDRGVTMLRFIERFSDEEMARLHDVLHQVRVRRGIAS